MVVSHSSQFPGCCIGCIDSTDIFVFTSDQGVSGVKLNLSNKTISIPGANPALNKVLTSNAVGDATWQDFTAKVSAIKPIKNIYLVLKRAILDIALFIFSIKSHI